MEDLKETELENDTKEIIEFDNKGKRFCGNRRGFGYSITFELTDNSMEYLFQIISNMPVISDEDKDKRKTLFLGACIRPVKV